MKRRFSILSILFFLLVVVIHPTGYSLENRVKFHSLDIKDGLTHNTVTSFVQDEAGFMWIGTRYGIVRYDGIRFKGFINQATRTQADRLNNISTLCLEYPYLWLGTADGSIECFDIETESYIDIKVSGNSYKGSIRCIVPHSSGYFIIGRDQHFSFAKLNAHEGKASYFEAHELTDTLPNELKNEVVRKIVVDNDNVWIVSNDGPFFYEYLNDKGFAYKPMHRVKQARSRLSSQLTDLLVEGDNIHMVHSNGLEIGKWQFTNDRLTYNQLHTYHISDIVQIADDGNTLTQSETIGNSKHYPSLNRLVKDRKGFYWLGSTKGLFQLRPLDDGTLLVNSYYHDKNSIYTLTRDIIFDLSIDNTDCLWVGTYEGGINYANLLQKNFHHYTFESNAPNLSTDFPVRAIYHTTDSLLLVGRAQGGVTLLNKDFKPIQQFWNQTRHTGSLSSSWIGAILPMDDNRIMIGTLSGIDYIDMQTHTIQPIRQQPTGKNRINRVSHITKRTNGDYWVATRSNGIYRAQEISNGNFKFTQYTAHSGLITQISSDTVNYLFYESERNELLASTRKGLSRIFLDEEGTPIRTLYYKASDSLTHSLGSNYLWSIAKESAGSYWLGTIGGGLNKIVFRDDLPAVGNIGAYRAEVYSNVGGLQLIDVDNVLVDNDKNLWFTANGLFFRDTKNRQWKWFDANEGLQQEKFTAGSAHYGSDGLIYLGSVSGITYFYPHEVKVNKIQPQIVLSDLLLRGKVVLPGDTTDGRFILPRRINEVSELTLRYNQNDFSIEFASLHYSNPGKQLYEYKLDGFDTEWKNTDQNYPIATYSNLDYGKYRFLLRGSTSDGTWSEDEVQLKISIRPPWFKSILAKIIYAALLFALSFLFYIAIGRWIRIQNSIRVNEEIHQMKLRFFTNISHELRTPLTLIMSPLEDLLNNRIPVSSQKSAFKLMYRNTNRLLRFINELMEFRKVETGVDKLKACEMNLSTFLRSIGTQFEPLAAKKNIRFEYQIPNDNLNIWVDKSKLEKIVLNLLSNAFKFTPEDGVVGMQIVENPWEFKFAKDKETFWVEKPHKQAQAIGILISDSGLGISSESLPEIFNRFYQLETANPNRHLGSGVGLAYVKSLVQVHKGNIVVASERNKGTDFMIVLPLGKDYLNEDEIVDNVPDFQSDFIIDNDESESSPQHDNSDMNPVGILGRDTKILIVEDNQEMRQYLKSKFIADFQVIEASDGVEGLKMVKENTPDLIISDLMMPNKDGMTMTRELKEDIETCHIPIILLTAKNTIEDKIQGSESGADIYVTKPFNYDYLRVQILNLIRNRKKLIEKFAQDALFEAKELGETKRDKDFFDKLYKFIEENIDNTELDSDLICRHVGVGRTTLFNKVKGLTDQSLGQFIRSIRLKTAAKHMIVDNLAVSEAAFRVGITSPSYFSRAFKEQFGKTPREFIEHYSEKS